MWRISNLFQKSLKRTFRERSFSVDISSEVSSALQNNYPVLALESTIITHGMPFPENLRMALDVEKIVKEQGAVPATIAVLGGRIKVGLTNSMMTELATLKIPAVKTSRRDFPYVLSKGLNGGTTVSGTILVAHKVGIHVFATGGIGGVHRGAETSMDVSTDLTELGRNPVTVVSSGVKSILDIGKTLEYLETQGVCVATLGTTRDFPAFYTPHSSFKSPYNVSTIPEAAALVHSLLELGMSSGLLLAVPIPDHCAMPADEIDAAIQEALAKAEKDGITGKEVTPYLLSAVSTLTSGKSLQSNISLMLNNATVGAQVAVELQKLLNSTTTSVNFSKNVETSSDSSSNSGRLVVLGGSVVDFTIGISEEAFQVDGSTHRGHVKQSAGGVGRNMADALSKMCVHPQPLLVSAVGVDSSSSIVLDSLQHLHDRRGIAILEDEHTAFYALILNSKGECLFGVGDMDIHRRLDSQLVRNFEKQLIRSPLVVMDGNLPEETIHYVLRVCRDAGVPVWFEPTDIRKASLPFITDLWKNLHFVSPNFNELRIMAKAAGITVGNSKHCDGDDLLKEARTLSVALAEHIAVVVVTLGKLGVLIARRGHCGDVLIPKEGCRHGDHSGAILPVSARMYYVPEFSDVVSVSGAGDCLAAGFIAGALSRLSEEQCVAVGMSAARLSLQSAAAVPATLFDVGDWERHAVPVRFSTLQPTN